MRFGWLRFDDTDRTMLNLRLRSNIGSFLRTLVPLHVNIATVVSVLLVLVAGVIVANDQMVGRRAALAYAKASFQNLGEIVRIGFQARRGPVETAVEATVATVSLLPADGIFSIDTVRRFARRLSETDGLDALYFGDRQGNFVIVSGLAGAARGGGPAYRSWIIRRPGPGEFDQTVITLDRDYGMLSTERRQHNDYDPRTRPWFHAAMLADRTVQTPPYVYFESNDIGITVAARTADGHGVVGGDLTLRTLSQMLGAKRATENSQTVVFDEKTFVLAASEIDHVLQVVREDERPMVIQQTLASTEFAPYRALSRLYASVRREDVHEVEADGKEWVVWISPLDLGGDRNATMGIVAPSDEVFAEVSERMRLNLWIAAFGVGIGLVIAWIVAGAISRPIRTLTGEAYQMRNFDLVERAPVRSRIVEVDQLSQAVQTLRRSLRDFARYVPAQLVRRLVAGDMTADVGGARCDVTLLFTDIADFTSISESMEPTVLMREMSEYLAEASRTLIQNGATIDKYIGDAIMAIWNAPVRQDGHVDLACRGALHTAAAIDELNERRVAEGRPPFHTRFGLHTGDAVVGNVGSDERLNYTALGASVNLAARLEGLNKQLGTRILLSESAVQALKADFLVRAVDVVLPKGTTRPVPVFELLAPGQYARDDADARAHIESWGVCYEAYTKRRWTEAIAEFDRHVRNYPEDAAAQVLRARAVDHEQTPPPADWDGVHEARTK